MLWQHHPLTLTWKEAPQHPRCITDVAEILSGSGHVPSSTATEKYGVNEHRIASVIFLRAQQGCVEGDSAQACASMHSWKQAAVRLLESIESISSTLEGLDFPQAQAEIGTIREYFLLIKRTIKKNSCGLLKEVVGWMSVRCSSYKVGVHVYSAW